MQSINFIENDAPLQAFIKTCKNIYIFRHLLRETSSLFFLLEIPSDIQETSTVVAPSIVARDNGHFVGNRAKPIEGLFEVYCRLVADIASPEQA